MVMTTSSVTTTTFTKNKNIRFREREKERDRELPVGFTTTTSSHDNHVNVISLSSRNDSTLFSMEPRLSFAAKGKIFYAECRGTERSHDCRATERSLDCGGAEKRLNRRRDQPYTSGEERGDELDLDCFFFVTRSGSLDLEKEGKKEQRDTNEIWIVRSTSINGSD